jgi:hypothetical protein
MTVWEYHVEVLNIECGTGEEWSIRDSPHGETKLMYRLDEFGSYGWELVSMLPVSSEQAVYAIFKRMKQ